MNSPADMLVLAMDQFTEILAETTDPNAATPCDQWRAIDVAGHVVGTLGKVLALLDGEEALAVPADPAEAGLTPLTMMARWGQRAEQVHQALDEADLSQERRSGFGAGPVERQLAVPTCDLAVHAWDVATSQGMGLELPEELRDFLRATVHQIPADRLRAPGMFATETEPPAGATDTEQIMAFLGRTVSDQG